MSHCNQTMNISLYDRWLRDASGIEEDNRQHGRRPFTKPVTVIDGDRTLDRVFCRDVSASGIGLLHFEEMTSDRVVVNVPAGGKTLELPCDVRWRRQYASDLYATGCQFDPTVVTTVSQGLMRSTWSEVERRMEQRYPFFRPVHLRTWSDVVSSSTMDGFTLDISSNGLRIMLREPLEIDKDVHVEVADSDRPIAEVMRLRVKWCEAFAPGMYRCGGQAIPFDFEQPSED